ncbi:MAG TPA: terminase small subunit [Rubrivivax sp.]|nr:terminase small subunit [Rubrivivax sp.]
MTPKQQRFVDEYLVDLNATAAARRAGYSERTAEQQGPRLLGNVGVRAAIAERAARISAKLELTAEKVLRDIARVANKAEHEGEYSAALKGHELLGKHLKLFVDKVEHGGPNGGPIPLAGISLTPEEFRAMALEMSRQV